MTPPDPGAGPSSFHRFDNDGVRGPPTPCGTHLGRRDGEDSVFDVTGRPVPHQSSVLPRAGLAELLIGAPAAHIEVGDEGWRPTRTPQPVVPKRFPLVRAYSFGPLERIRFASSASSAISLKETEKEPPIDSLATMTNIEQSCPSTHARTSTAGFVRERSR